MKLSKIKIQGLLNLKNVEICLSDEGTLVVGPNGTGKTNIIKCVTWAIKRFVELNIENGRIYPRRDQSSGIEALDKTVVPLLSLHLSKERSVSLWFTLNKEEQLIVMQLRLLDVLSRCFYLWRFLGRKFLSSHHVKELEDLIIDDLKIEEKFENFAEENLSKLFRISSETLDAGEISKKDAEVMLKCIYIDNIGNFCDDMDLSNIKLPDIKEQEFEIISEGFRKMFGDQIHVFEEELSKPKQWCKLGESTTLKLDELLKIFLDQNEFLRSQTQGYTENTSTYTVDCIPQECFYSTLWRRMPSSSIKRVAIQIETRIFHETVTNKPLEIPSDIRFLRNYISMFLEKSVCVLAQSRGSLKSEQGVWFWDMKEVEAKIVSAHNCVGESKGQLLKVKEAMLFMTSLELDVTNGQSSFGNKIIASLKEGAKTSEDPEWPVDQAEFLQVVLRDFKRPQSRWMGLEDHSGGQRELLMVLSAIHLSGAQTVILDEPGHSLHPPKQAQLRRWFETRREKEQALFVITHSTEMVSPNWLGSLYHMKPDGDRYTAACLRQAMEEEPGMVVSSDADGEEAADGHRVNVDDPTTSNSPSTFHAGRITNLGANVIDFLMGVEMRRLFFSSGAIFVEGDSDRRVVQALRDVALEKVNETLEDVESTIQQWREAHKELEMDRWDIIPISGSANWPKAYLAAENLGIPFVVILDADVLHRKQGTNIFELNYKEWLKSRLCSSVKSEIADGHPLKERVKKIEAILKGGGDRVESRVREEIEKFNLWVWNDDLEDLFFARVPVREALKSEHFQDVMREMGVVSTEQASSHGHHVSEQEVKENIDQINCFFEEGIANENEKFKNFVDDVKKSPEDTELVEKFANGNPLKAFAGQVKQKVSNHATFVKRSKRRRFAEEGEQEEEKAEQVRRENLEDSYWRHVKRKLHDKGGWKNIPYELLKEMVRASFDKDTEDRSLRTLWKFVKGQLVDPKTKPRVPSWLLERKVESMCQ